MLKGKKAVIFDMDGSLVDSMWIWTEVDRIYMEKYGLTEPETFHKDIEGMSYVETARYFVDTFHTLGQTVEAGDAGVAGDDGQPVCGKSISKAGGSGISGRDEKKGCAARHRYEQ